ncbi:BRCT domain-containing protein [Neptunomonas japonica]|uniref:BRCT domain-containing protein n=1 Tax=Neptunomonas japonica TaxID=417574 RepID=UPI00041AA5F4|nr:BRCT domain-containing protein [Neptunomonas japonica]
MTIGNDVNGQSVTARLHAAKRMTREKNELYGICRGIIFDGEVNQAEAENLLLWLNTNPELTQHWPANVIYKQLTETLSNGGLNQENAAALLKLLRDAVGDKQKQECIDTSTGEVLTDSISTSLPVIEIDEIKTEGAAFVLTGKFASGTRTECEAMVISGGGSCAKSPTKKTNYLIIGDLGSRDWASTSSGRKIEKAVAMREAGHPIKIISEKNWAELLSS